MENEPAKILVIDDEAAITRLFGAALKDFDCDVVPAHSGEEGIEKFKGGGCRIVFLDLQMPAMSGIETLRRIRRMDPEVPVYVISGFYEKYFNQLKEVSDDGLEFEVIKKPVDTGSIRAVVGETLGTRPAKDGK